MFVRYSLICIAFYFADRIKASPGRAEPLNMTATTLHPLLVLLVVLDEILDVAQNQTLLRFAFDIVQIWLRPWHSSYLQVYQGSRGSSDGFLIYLRWHGISELLKRLNDRLSIENGLFAVFGFRARRWQRLSGFSLFILHFFSPQTLLKRQCFFFKVISVSFRLLQPVVHFF